MCSDPDCTLMTDLTSINDNNVNSSAKAPFWAVGYKRLPLSVVGFPMRYLDAADMSSQVVPYNLSTTPNGKMNKVSWTMARPPVFVDVNPHISEIGGLVR